MSRNPVYSFFASPRSLAPVFLRLAVAAVFFYHGTRRALGWFGGAGWEGTMTLWTAGDGVRLPAFLVALMMVASLTIVVALVLGFFTRAAGLGILLLVGIPLFFSAETTRFETLEYPLVLLACGLAFMAMGGGRLSLDRALSTQLLPEISD